MTQWQVRQIWEAADLKPHRLKTFKLSQDPHFAEKVIDVVGLYLNPPDNALVLSVDEKTQIQALDRTHPMLPLRPGQVERRTHDYKRHGTTNLYAAFNVATGEVLGRITRRHRATEFRQFLAQIDRATPSDLALHLIVDNSSTHTTEVIRDFLAAHPRFHLHFTPTSASWLNAVETWFGQLERRALRRGVFTSVSELRDAIRGFIQAHNTHAAKPFRWAKSAQNILDAVGRARDTMRTETFPHGRLADPHYYRGRVGPTIESIAAQHGEHLLLDFGDRRRPGVASPNTTLAALARIRHARLTHAGGSVVH